MYLCGLGGGYEVVGEQGLPVLETVEAVVAGQLGVALKAVGTYAVAGTQQAVEEGGDEQMLLGPGHVGARQAGGVDLLEHDACVGPQCGNHRRAVVEEGGVAAGVGGG